MDSDAPDVFRNFQIYENKQNKETQTHANVQMEWRFGSNERRQFQKILNMVYASRRKSVLHANVSTLLCACGPEINKTLHKSISINETKIEKTTLFSFQYQPTVFM